MSWRLIVNTACQDLDESYDLQKRKEVEDRFILMPPFSSFLLRSEPIDI
jgi:hypothetical protein